MGVSSFLSVEWTSVCARIEKLIGFIGEYLCSHSVRCGAWTVTSSVCTVTCEQSLGTVIGHSVRVQSLGVQSFLYGDSVTMYSHLCTVRVVAYIMSFI